MAQKITQWLKLTPDQHKLLTEFADAEHRSNANAAEVLVARGLACWQRTRKREADHAEVVSALLTDEGGPDGGQ